MSPSFGLTDLTTYGRREGWEDSPDGRIQFPTHAVLLTDEHDTPGRPGEGARHTPQWTRPGVTGLGQHPGSTAAEMGAARH